MWKTFFAGTSDPSKVVLHSKWSLLLLRGNVFSAGVLERFASPANSGRLADATHHGLAGIPGEGPFLEIWLRIEDEFIQQASFETYGCPAAIACGSLITELVTGKEVALAKSIEPQDLMIVLGGLPEGKEHCAERAIMALKSALDSTSEPANDP